MSPFFEHDPEDYVALSRHDPEELLGTFSPHSILLDGEVWPTIEHYYQAMQYEDPARQQRIRTATSPHQAERLGEPKFIGRFFHKPRKDWSISRSVYMTRAIYTKCKTYPDVAQRLLDTGDEKLLETSQYDYYWGCGRDMRGDNTYGQVLMNVRAKLREELAGTDS